MTDQNPITPPSELIQQWKGTAYDAAPIPYTHHIARCAAQWGADQQLEADCEWLTDQSLHLDGSYLRFAMRPKPPSLKEQALEALTKIEDNKATYLDSSVIRRALEALPND